MKVYTVTESIDYSDTSILGIYATAVRAKEACRQEAEAEAAHALWKAEEAEGSPLRVPMAAFLRVTEDGNTLSIRVGSTVFGVDEHEVVAA